MFLERNLLVRHTTGLTLTLVGVLRKEEEEAGLSLNPLALAKDEEHRLHISIA